MSNKNEKSQADLAWNYNVVEVTNDTTPDSNVTEAKIKIQGYLSVTEDTMLGKHTVPSDTLVVKASPVGTYVIRPGDHPDNNGKTLINYEVNILGTDKTFEIQIPEGGFVKDAIDPNTGEVVGKITVPASEMLKNAINENIRPFSGGREENLITNEVGAASAIADLMTSVGEAAVVTNGVDDEGNKIVVGGDAAQAAKIIGEVDKRAREQAQDFLKKLTGYGAQNFFMENIVPFVNRATKTSRGKGYGQNIRLVSTDNPSELLHIMTAQKDGIPALQEGTALDYSLITPQVKIFLELSNGKEIEVPFSNHLGDFTSDALLKSREGRADDVGFVELKWNYYSGDAGTFVRSDAGELSLTLYFQTGESIFRKRKVGKDLTFDYSEFLGIKSTKSNQDEAYLYDQSRIRIVVGYDYEDRAASHGSSHSFFKAAGKAKKAMTCLPAQEYDLDVQQDGSILVTFKYHFTSNGVLKDNTFDIFDRRKTADLKKQIQKIKVEIEKEKSAHEMGGQAPILQKPETEPKKETQVMKNLEEAQRELSQEYKKALSDVYKYVRESILKRAFKISFTQGALQNYLLIRQVAKGRATLPETPGESHHWDRSVDMKDSKIVASPFSEQKFPETGPAGGGAQKLKDAAKDPSEEPTTVADAAELEAAAAAAAQDNLEKKTANEKEAAASTKSPGDKDSLEKDKKASASGQENLEISGSDDVDLYYVYFGDLLEAFLEQPNIKESLNKENYTIVLGQIMMSEVLVDEKNAGYGSGIALNIADLPISLDNINSWFTEVFVKPQIDSMTLHELIFNLSNRLITPILNNPDTIRGNDVLRTRTLKIGYITSKNKPSDIFTGGRHKLIGSEFLKHITATTPVAQKNKHNYLILSSDPTGFYISGKGTPESDAAIGRYHYYMASDKGLLKNVSFSKESLGPEARVLNIAAAATDNSVKTGMRFWEPYTVDMELFGTPYLEPYSIFFLNPSMPGMGSISNKSSAAYKLQIGGYYHMMDITNTISDGIWTSNVQGSRALGIFAYQEKEGSTQALVRHKPIS